MNTETELKLGLDSAGLRRLRHHPVIGALRQARSVTRIQKSVYFDTPDQSLRSAEMVLRVRHIGRRRIQTLKTLGQALGGARIRGEWESEISGDAPELPPLQSADIPDFAPDQRLIDALVPVFTTEVKRTTIVLAEADWEIELALDEGQIVSSRGSVPLIEAEFELKRGEPHHLFGLVLRIHHGIAARVLVASKAERGFALLDGASPQAQKAQPVHLATGMTAGEAFRAIAGSCVEQILANQAHILDTHAPEAVHQMRVGLRRLRSAINLFKGFLDTPETVWLKEEFRWLQAALGAARDSDVFIEEILDPLAEPWAGEPGYRALRQDFLAARQDAYDRALDTLGQPRFTELMLRLGKWTEDGDWFHDPAKEKQASRDQPADQLAVSVLTMRDRKVRKGMRHLSELPPEERHRVRIDVKKLRYAVEFFASLYPARKAKKLASALGTLQDRLGLLNDIAVSRSRLRQQAQEDAERLWAAGLIAGWHTGLVGRLLDQAHADWKAYDKLPRFWHGH